MYDFNHPNEIIHAALVRADLAEHYWTKAVNHHTNPMFYRPLDDGEVTLAQRCYVEAQAIAFHQTHALAG